MEPCEQGEWVRYDDMNELTAKCDELRAERDELRAERDEAMKIGHVILAKLPKARRLFDDTSKEVESLEEMMNLLMLVCAEPDEEEE